MVLRNPHCTPRTLITDGGYVEMCYERPKRNKQLILPPTTVQLPRGLGYFAAAIPDVTAAYLESLSYNEIIQEMDDMVIPIVDADSCISIASPLCPQLGPLINPIIL
ncbi:hypothetical protein RR46_12541 [Papilio xuthus]|uniref:Uncharacterized protein n=1 Tax=Papilio xuthus TaxID=66420 RepID=A0A194PSV7_PAPXU|nr:hypothetical protein RR46_12541 [Papilio xuthus]